MVLQWKIDGVYGWGTYWAVRNFQSQFGVKKVDGLVGEKQNLLVQKTKYYKEFVQQQLQKEISLRIMAGNLLISKQRLLLKETRKKTAQGAKENQKVKAEETARLGSQETSQEMVKQIKRRNKQQPTCQVVFKQ